MNANDKLVIERSSALCNTGKCFKDFSYFVFISLAWTLLTQSAKY